MIPVDLFVIMFTSSRFATEAYAGITQSRYSYMPPDAV